MVVYTNQQVVRAGSLSIKVTGRVSRVRDILQLVYRESIDLCKGGFLLQLRP